MLSYRKWLQRLSRWPCILSEGKRGMRDDLTWITKSAAVSTGPHFVGSWILMGLLNFRPKAGSADKV